MAFGSTNFFFVCITALKQAFRKLLAVDSSPLQAALTQKPQYLANCKNTICYLKWKHKKWGYRSSNFIFLFFSSPLFSCRRFLSGFAAHCNFKESSPSTSIQSHCWARGQLHFRAMSGRGSPIDQVHQQRTLQTEERKLVAIMQTTLNTMGQLRDVRPSQVRSMHLAEWDYF